jgi:hypothetical protein
MRKDIGETNNLFEKNPEKVEVLLGLLKADVSRGRSTNGPESKNDVPVEEIVLWKSEGKAKKRK